ncbi:MAG: DinB family protein [Cytophagaceae bacterium]|nr:DinB family protein [Gemmatimonadaceae bacterium]
MHTLLSIFRTTNHVVVLSLEDLTDELARRRSRGSEGPSVTWTIGHLLDFRHKVLALLGAQRPNPWEASYGDVAATDGAEYPTLEAMRAEWNETHGALEKA